MNSVIAITFLSEYQVSSGLGDGHWADSWLVRDHNGLPYLPGRAVRGALREAAWRLGQCREDLRLVESLLWGTRSTNRVSNRQGILRVGQGELPSELKDSLVQIPPSERETVIRDMSVIRVQTALVNGQVKATSLRTIECGIPGLTFLSEVGIADGLVPSCLNKEWLKDYLRAVCAGLKSMGGNRSRGLGRCEVRMLDDTVSAGRIQLPSPLDTSLLKEELAADLDSKESAHSAGGEQ